MNPFTFILKSKLLRGWKCVVIGLLITMLSALPFLIISAYAPEFDVPQALPWVALLGVMAGFITMVIGFIVLLYDIYTGSS